MDSLLLSTSTVGCSVSILFSLSAVVVLSCYRVKTRPLKIKQHFSISIVLTNIVILTGLQGVSGQNECRLVMMLLHYTVLACFGWICMDTYYILSCIRHHYVKLSFLKIALIIWCFPIPFMLLALILGLSSNSKFGSVAYTCWKSDHIIWALVIPCFCIIVYSTYMLVLSAYMTLNQMNSMSAVSKQPKETVWYSIKTQIIMLLITTIIWVFGVQTFWYPKIVNFQLIFGLGAGVQGLLLFFFYCVFCLELDLFVNDNITEGYPEVMRYDDFKDEKSDSVERPVDTVQLTNVTPIKDSSYQSEENVSTEKEKIQHDGTQKEFVVDKIVPVKTKAIVHNSERYVSDTSEANNVKNDEEHDVSENLSQATNNALNTPDIKKKQENKESFEMKHNTPPKGYKTAYSNHGSFTGSDDLYHMRTNSSTGSPTSSTSVMSVVGVTKYDGRVSRTSNLSYASNMGMNELESLFNNPDLMNYSLPKKNRPTSLSMEVTEKVIGIRKPAKNRAISHENKGTSDSLPQTELKTYNELSGSTEETESCEEKKDINNSLDEATKNIQEINDKYNVYGETRQMNLLVDNDITNNNTITEKDYERTKRQ